MKLSELCDADLLAFLHLEPEDMEIPPELILTGARQYIKSYTGLSLEEIDEYEDLTVAALVLCSDMYDNRQTTVERGNVNKTVDTILSLHCRNLV